MQMDKVPDLLQWFKERGIEYEGVRVISDRETYSGEALAVVASQGINEGAVLVTIPKTAVLSVKNTSLAPFLEENRIGGGLGLVLACMHELALGTKSPWCAYLRSLPRREYLPMFWTQEEQNLLIGTDAAKRPEADRRDTAADFESEVVPLLSQGADYFDTTKMSLESFRVAASWIGSRAFGVDDYHGMALVPFADIFNHKVSIVSLSENYELEGACMEQASSDEGDEEGSDSQAELGEDGSDSEEEDGGCLEENYEADGEDQEVGKARSRESEESVDEGHDRPPISAVTRGSMLDAEMYPHLDLRLQIGICGAQRDGQEVLEIIAACPLVEGQEVFNTFGELDNSELVCKYGFALHDNPFSNLQLDKDLMVAKASKLLGSRECKRRCSYLEKQSDLLEEEDEPFLMLPKGQIGPSLLVAARILSATPTEFARIKSCDLTDALEQLQVAEVPDLVNIQPRKRQKLNREAQVMKGNGPAEDGEAATAAVQASNTGLGEVLEVEGAALGNTRIEKSSAWFPPTLCSLLTDCLEERLEGQCATIAALTLVLSEKAILTEALKALGSNY